MIIEVKYLDGWNRFADCCNGERGGERGESSKYLGFSTVIIKMHSLINFLIRLNTTPSLVVHFIRVARIRSPH